MTRTRFWAGVAALTAMLLLGAKLQLGQVCIARSCQPATVIPAEQDFNACGGLAHGTQFCSGAVITKKIHYQVWWSDNHEDDGSKYYCVGTGEAYQTEVCEDVGILFNASMYQEDWPAFDTPTQSENYFIYTARNYNCTLAWEDCIAAEPPVQVDYGQYLDSDNVGCSLDTSADDTTSVHHICQFS